MYTTFCEVVHVLYEICEQTDKQRDRHTDMLTAILHSSQPYGGQRERVKYLSVTKHSALQHRLK